MNESEYLKEVGRKIKLARKAKGLYLRDLGKLCKMHFGAISEIENGKRDSHILTIKNIADKLEVDMKDFL